MITTMVIINFYLYNKIELCDNQTREMMNNLKMFVVCDIINIMFKTDKSLKLFNVLYTWSFIFKTSVIYKILIILSQMTRDRFGSV